MQKITRVKPIITVSSSSSSSSSSSVRTSSSKRSSSIIMKYGLFCNCIEYRDRYCQTSQNPAKITWRQHL